MPKVTTPGEYINPVSIGPRLESIPVLAPALGPIAGSGNYTSNQISADGFYDLVVALKSTQAGAINVQRYYDDGGLLPFAAVDTVAIVANTVAALKISDGVPMGSFTIQITNTGGSPATVSPISVRNVPH